jgi:hypothetical protein
MTDNNKNIPKESEPEIPDRLVEDVRVLLEPELSVPPEIDRAILDRANRHFTERQFGKTQRRFRWVALWKVAAAAAVVIFAFSLDLHKKPQQIVYDSTMAKMDAADFDRDGQVNILDAFKLAKQIEQAGNSEVNLDINGDGLVNSDDIDKIAFAAVSLSPTNQRAGKGVL